MIDAQWPPDRRGSQGGPIMWSSIQLADESVVPVPRRKLSSCMRPAGVIFRPRVPDSVVVG